MIYAVIYSLLVLTEKVVFFNKQLWGFIISLRNTLVSKLFPSVSGLHIRLGILGKNHSGVFPISRFLVNPLNKNCHNSETSHDIDMKLGPVTKPDMGNTSTSKKVDHDAMSTNRDVIVFLPIHGQFAAIQKTHSGSMVYKTYIFINSNLLSYRSWKQN